VVHQRHQRDLRRYPEGCGVSGVLAEVGDVRFDPRNILILGWTDSSGIDSGDDLLAGREEAKLADTMMLVRIDPPRPRLP